MKAKILVVTDLHKRYSDMRNIKNILPVQHLIQKDIINFCKVNKVTHVLIAGDWYDRGFHGLGKAYSAMEEDRLLSKCVNGNVYICLGNHFFLERDENPEMYIIQPNEYIKPRDVLQFAEEPVFKMVPTLKIGTVQISFFHFSKVSKNYVCQRDEDTTFHIGIYHDDKCVPSWVREREGFGGSSSSYELYDIYKNIDLAIHGHIHSAIGLFNVELPNAKKVPLWVPGALGMTQSKDSIKHTEVNLPVIEIGDDNCVAIKSAPFSTHLDQLKFYKTEKKDKTIADLASNKKFATPLATPTNSLSAYLQQFGFSDSQLKIVEEACSGMLSVQSAVSILSGGNNDKCTTTNSGT